MVSFPATFLFSGFDLKIGAAASIRAMSFPHPAEMQQRLSNKGRKMVTIIDPHIKRDSNYYIYQQVLCSFSVA
jgi:predicted  nucleic acid-binding Zn ribbon protein